MKNTSKCVVCNSTFKKRCENHKYCSENCRREREKGRYRDSSLNHLPTSKIGGISELEVCAYYLREGYEVFRNVSASGPADIIVWNPESGEVHIIDVKTYVSCLDPKNFITNLENKSDNKVKILPYNYNTRETLRALSVHPD